MCEAAWAKGGAQLGRLAAWLRASFVELWWYISETYVVPQFLRWYAISAHHMQNAVVMPKDRKHPFVSHVLATYRSRRTELNALMPGRPCSIYLTIFHAVTKTGLQLYVTVNQES